MIEGQVNTGQLGCSSPTREPKRGRKRKEERERARNTRRNKEKWRRKSEKRGEASHLSSSSLFLLGYSTGEMSRGRIAVAVGTDRRKGS